MNKTTHALNLAEEALLPATLGALITAERANKALAAIREALADQFRDATKMVAEHKCGGCAKTAADGWALYCVECWEKAEPVKQEPVAVVEITYGREPECYVTGNINDFPEGVFKLYAAPVRTKDLTGQDLCDLEVSVDWKGDSHEFEAIVKAAIAKYKEKNK